MESVTASGGVDGSGGSRSSPGAAVASGTSSGGSRSGSSGVSGSSDSSSRSGSSGASGSAAGGIPAGGPAVRSSPWEASVSGSSGGSASSGAGVGGIPITEGPVGVNFFSDIIEMAAEEKQEAEEAARKQQQQQSKRAHSQHAHLQQQQQQQQQEQGQGHEGSSSSSSSSSSSDSESGDEMGSGGAPTAEGSAATELPELSLGNDDIEWMSVLHRALQSSGYYPSDDEVENWLFGEGTQEALLAFQACNRLPETGVVGQPTWDVLLSADDALRSEAYTRAARSGNGAEPGSSTSGSVSTQGPESGSTSSQDDEGWMTDEDAVRALNASGGKWPVLVENEGGKEVQLMQLALSSQGYHCGEDEMQYWMFGEMTSNALRTFQACAGLKETGVCDERTWKKLLRNDRASPEDLPWLRERLLAELKAKGVLDEDYAADITEGDNVFLLGEQRWEKR